MHRWVQSPALYKQTWRCMSVILVLGQEGQGFKVDLSHTESSKPAWHTGAIVLKTKQQNAAFH